MEEIKNCPFCGIRGHKRTIEIDQYTKIHPIKKTGLTIKRKLIECRNPECSIQPSTWLHTNTVDLDIAIEAWNRRPADKDRPEPTNVIGGENWPKEQKETSGYATETPGGECGKLVADGEAINTFIKKIAPDALSVFDRNFIAYKIAKKFGQSHQAGVVLDEDELGYEIFYLLRVAPAGQRELAREEWTAKHFTSSAKERAADGAKFICAKFGQPQGKVPSAEEIHQVLKNFLKKHNVSFCFGIFKISDAEEVLSQDIHQLCLKAMKGEI